MRSARVTTAGLLAVLVLSLVLLAGCSPAPTPTPSPTLTSPGAGGPRPGGGALVRSDSVITAKIVAIHQQTTGYPWDMDILVQSSVDVENLPNPTKDSVGKTITVKTDQDLAAYKVGDVITARVKYVGDVPLPGIALYIYNIAPEIRP